MRINTPGLEQWVRDFEQARQILESMMTIGSKVAVEWRRETQLRAPVDTGNMRNSVETKARIRGTVLEVSNIVPTNYAKYVEHGTATQPPQPFQGPATDVVQPQFEAALSQAIEKITGNPVRATGDGDGGRSLGG